MKSSRNASRCQHLFSVTRPTYNGKGRDNGRGAGAGDGYLLGGAWRCEDRPPSCLPGLLICDLIPVSSRSGPLIRDYK